MLRPVLAALCAAGVLLIGNVCQGAVTLVSYFDLQSHGTVSGGQTITDAVGNTQATLNNDANTSLTGSGLTISGGNSRNTGLNLAAGSLSSYTGSFSIQVWVTVQSGGGTVLYGGNNGPANGYIANGFDGFAAIYGFTWGSCTSGGGSGNTTGTAYNRYGQTAGLGYSMTAGALYDIVLTYDEVTRTFRQYVNGALTGTQVNHFSQNSLTQAQNFTIGGGTATQTWGDGSALSTTRSFLLYRGVLSASQVTNIHNLGAGASLAAIQSQLPADDSVVWTGAGGDNNWSTAANWASTNAPGSGASVVFAGSTQLTANMETGYSVSSLTFSNNAGSFNLTNAASTLALTGGLTNNSANVQTINVPVSLYGAQSINAAVGNLVFGQNVNNNGNTVTFAGNGDITLNGMLAGPGGVVKSGSGTLTISLPMAPPVSYGGGTLIQSGTLQLNNSGFRIITSTFSGGGDLIVCTNGGVVGPLLLWGTNNLTGTTTVSNGLLFVACAPNQSLGSTLRVHDGATLGVLARADTNYISTSSLILGSSTGATLQFGLKGLSEPGLTGTDNAPIQAGAVTINGTATINIASCPFATNSYPLFTGYGSGNLALGSQPLGCSGKLTVNSGTVYYTVTNLNNAYRPFVHPGCMSTLADLQRIQVKVQAGLEPWASGYAVLTNNWHSSASYNANPLPYVNRGGADQNYSSMMNDAAAAYQSALRWRLTGDTSFAEAARRNLDGYSSTLVSIGGSTDALLLLGAQGFQFACAAELLRDYQPWVDSGGFARFQMMLIEKFYQSPVHGNGLYWFLQAHNGTCYSHYWLNWDGFALSAAAAIGVVCDRRDVFDHAVNYYKGAGVGNGMATRAVHFMHPGYLGQSQEAGRDMGHASLDPVLFAQFAEVAWNQGEDLYGFNDNGILAMNEYTVRAMTPDGVPWVNYAGCDVNTTTVASGSLFRAGQDLIWNHYVNRRGLSAPYTLPWSIANRPEGGGGNYGGNSGGFDQIGFTTLTHALDPVTNSTAPSALRADVPLAGTARIWWWGGAYATGYNVKRATSVGGPYTLIATNLSPNDLIYTDTGLMPDSTYYYVASAIINGAETTNSLPVGVTANQRLTGSVIGTDSVFINGQWKYQLFDNAPVTWFDASNPSGAWAGLDLGVPHRITKVGYYPRRTFAGRMTGGRFQGCNVADFSSGVVTLFTIGSQPPEGTATIQDVTNTNGYRYVRYIGPPNGYCNAAEVQFYGVPGEAAAPMPPTLHAYLKFDESSGTSAADATGHGWDGTLVNSATRVAGYSNNAVNLSSGASQYVTLPSGVLADLDAVSITAWVKQTSISIWSRIFDFGTGQTVNMFLTPRNGANNVLRFAITTGGGAGEQIIDGTSELPTGVWKHVAVTIGGSGGVLYVDGVPVGTNSAMTLSPSFLGITTQNYLGKSQYNDPYFNGQVDELRIYNGALSAGDVATFVTPLAAPTNVIAGAGDGQIALNWNAATNASSYNILCSLTSGGPYTQITNVSATTFTNIALANGVMHHYVVRAANAVGESPDSIQVGARPVSSVPANLSLILSGGQLQFNWPADHTGWRLQMNINLATGVWQDVTGADATNVISIPPTNSSTFFRMVYP